MVDRRQTIEKAIEILSVVADSGGYEDVYDDEDISYQDEIYEEILQLEQMYSELDDGF